MSQQGITVRCGDFKATSRNLRLTLEVMPGSEDLTLQHFRKFIESSGRLPTNDKVKPRFNIRGIPIEEYASHLTQTLETKVEELETEINETKKEGNELRKALEKRTKQLEERKKSEETLKEKLSRTPSGSHSSPKYAILNGYLQYQSDALLEAFLNATDMQTSKDLEFFMNYQERKPTFSEYLQHHTNMDFENDNEIDEWLKELSNTKNWKETEKGKALLNEKDQLEKDQTIYKTERKQQEQAKTS